jgi:hypothetical protein
MTPEERYANTLAEIAREEEAHLNRLERKVQR